MTQYRKTVSSLNENNHQRGQGLEGHEHHCGGYSSHGRCLLYRMTHLGLGTKTVFIHILLLLINTPPRVLTHFTFSAAAAVVVPGTAGFLVVLYSMSPSPVIGLDVATADDDTRLG
jgi:hypothetical protein